MTAQMLTATPASPKVAFRHLVAVEGRKMVNTRSGKVLVAVSAVLSLVIALLPPLLQLDELRSGSMPWMELAENAELAPAVFVPILAIMLFTGEWSQGTVLHTFVAEPRRSRVLAAKALAALVATVAVWVLCRLVGAGIGWGLEAFAGVNIDWTFDWRPMLGSLLVFVFSAAQGAVLGLLLMHTALAIVLYFVIPMLAGVMAVSGTVMEVMTWIVPLAALQPLERMQFEGNDLWKLLSVFTIWVVLPGVLGWIRQTRAEVS